uniref:Uncharacterized protein n=1 Tax=Musca domestica TaxID=7370 RepID=A0A1I8MIW4_MUSDO
MASSLKFLFGSGVILGLVLMSLAQSQGGWGGNSGQPGQPGQPGEWGNSGSTNYGGSGGQGSYGSYDHNDQHRYHAMSSSTCCAPNATLLTFGLLSIAVVLATNLKQKLF